MLVDVPRLADEAQARGIKSELAFTANPAVDPADPARSCAVIFARDTVPSEEQRPRLDSFGPGAMILRSKRLALPSAGSYVNALVIHFLYGLREVF
jgi:hypothetical protein